VHFLTDILLFHNEVSTELNGINGRPLELCWITFNHKINITH